MIKNRLHLLIIDAFILFILYLFLSTPTYLSALDPHREITQYNIRVWDMTRGLPVNSIHAILQTRDGYLWIGTGDGLVRFDGVNFVLYNKRKNPQLAGNVIRALYEDRDGVLWIGTDSGGISYYRAGEFFTYSNETYQALNRIRAISEDRQGHLWIGSLGKGLTCFKNNTFTTYTTREGLPHNEVRSIYRDGKGELWVTTTTGIVNVSVEGEFLHITDRAKLPGFKTACLYEEDKDETWIGTGDSGLFRLKNGDFTAYGIDAGIPHHAITYLYRDKLKSLWIGTDGGGLLRMRGGVFSTLPGGNGLVSGSVYPIYEDREGSLWVGTADGGLHQLRDSKFITFTEQDGLSDNSIHCAYEDRGGTLWLGSDNGLNRLKQGKIMPPVYAKADPLRKRVLSLFEDRAGSLWIGTRGGLLKRKNGKTAGFTTKDGLSDNTITCIHEDRAGSLWVGTGSGLNRLRNRSRAFEIFTTKDGLLSPFITFIHEDSRGKLWIGTEAGLHDLQDGIFTAFHSPGIDEVKIYQCVFEDNKGTLWFGSSRGLVRLRGKEAALYTVRSGLIENYVFSILEDDKGYLWLGGRNGISRIMKQEFDDVSRGKIDRVHPESFNENDGMKSRLCTGPGQRTRDGRFWFPTTVGVTMIDPDHIEKNKLDISLIIEKLIVDGVPVDIHAAIKENRPVKLAPGKKRLEIYYTGISFINPERVTFKSRLVGWDSKWIEMGTLRSTSYTGLSPGRYTFQVMAGRSDGDRDEQRASLTFYLRPYFYQTLWFFILFALSILTGAFTYHRFRIRKLQTRKRELGELVELRTKDLKERTVELENARQKIQHSKALIEAKNRQLEGQSHKLKEMDKMKSHFFANISHEFRTPLTLIMGPLEQLISESKDSGIREKARLMLRNSRRLLGLINQLLDLSKFESRRMTLHAAPANIVPFLKGIVSSFDSLTAQKEIALTFHSEAEEFLLYFDAEKIEKAVSNLLSNAVKFTRRGGQIGVTLNEVPDPSPGILAISVKDTGIGIPEEKLAHIFDRFYQADDSGEYFGQGTGIGLALTRELVQLHHGQIDVRSEVGKGSEFIIALPLGDSHLEAGEKTAPPGESPGYDISRDMEDITPEEAGVEEPGTTDLIESPAAEETIVLVVDDNADVREYIRGPLQPRYRVVEAKDGQEGIEKARKIIPDLVISDVMMPKVDGIELCKTLKQDIATSHIPIILLTAKAGEESVVSGLETGADDYITKPFSTKILSVRIKNLIDLRRHLQQTLSREMTLQPAGISVSKLDKEFLTDLQEIIEKNISDSEFNVEQLRKKLYMSGATLYRKIFALSGESPTEFIRSYRLKRAAQLLKSGSGSITEIAFEVGFSSRAYFTKCFKNKFHQLPSDYQVREE